MGVPTPRPHTHQRERLEAGPGRWAFPLMAVGLVALMCATTVPTPLYGTYETTLGLSQAEITAIYAVYAVPLVVTLLCVGELSDHVGRRRILLLSFLLAGGGMIVLARADGLGDLVLGRVVHGLATGLATGALASGLIDWTPRRHTQLGASLGSAAPTIGLAVGALASGLLVQYAPHPTVTVYLVFAGIYVAIALSMLRIREPVLDRAGAVASLVPRLGVPREGRASFYWLIPGIVAIAAIGGQFNALAPLVLERLLHVENQFVGSAAIAAVHGTATVASLVGVRARSATVLLVGGSCALIVGAGSVLTSILLENAAVYFLAAVACGAGIGTVFLGAIRVAASIASYGQRAGLLSTLNVVNYTALTVPLVFAGAAATRFGLFSTFVVYTSIQMVLAVISVVGQYWLWRQGRTRRGRGLAVR